jgi:hypothetical protein
MARFSLLAVLLLLGGCSILEAKPSAVVNCPPVVSYSAAFQAAAAAELKTAGPHVQQMVADYGNERDRLRACREPAK